nr:serine hydrolase [Enemella evansiae]
MALAERGRVAERETERLPSASLIKVPIALAVLRARDGGLLRLDDAVAVDAVPVVGGAGVLRQLSGRPTCPVGDLLTLMLTVSDNLATNLLLEQLDRATGSAYAAGAEVCELAGLADTVLQRRMMDPAAVDAGRDNWTTAADQCRLMALIAGDAVSSLVGTESATVLRDVLLPSNSAAGWPRWYRRIVNWDTKPAGWTASCTTPDSCSPPPVRRSRRSPC